MTTQAGTEAGRNHMDDMNHANDNAPRYLTADELSARWNRTISPRTLANWRCAGCGPRFVKIGGRILYSIAAIEEWENARTVSSTSQYTRTV